MTKEEYVKMLISNSGHTVKSFAASIDLPYTTLLSMLSRGLGGASIDNVIRVCKGLSITVEDLQCVEEDERKDSSTFQHFENNFSPHEQNIIKKYRALDERGKIAVDETLDREYEFVKPKVESKQAT